MQIRDSNLSFASKYKFFDLVDQLPEGQKRMMKKIWVSGGDIPTVDGQAPAPEPVELYMRNSLECVAALLGNPVFSTVSKYASETMLVQDKNGSQSRGYNEMWHGDWWREIEVRQQRNSTWETMMLIMNLSAALTRRINCCTHHLVDR
jgi:hypothetical protein